MEPLALAFDLCRAAHVLHLVHTAVREAAAANAAWVAAASSTTSSSSRCEAVGIKEAGGTVCAAGGVCHTTADTGTHAAEECCLELPGWAEQLPATIAAAQEAVTKLMQLR